MNRAIEIAPKYFELYERRAELFMQTHRYKLALRDIETSLKLNSDSSRTYFLSGTLNALLGNLEIAENNYKQCLIKNDQQPESKDYLNALINLGLVMFYRGRIRVRETTKINLLKEFN